MKTSLSDYLVPNAIVGIITNTYHKARLIAGSIKLPSHTVRAEINGAMVRVFTVPNYGSLMQLSGYEFTNLFVDSYAMYDVGVLEYLSSRVRSVTFTGKMGVTLFSFDDIELLGE